MGKQQQLGWINNLKVISLYAVIVLHSSAILLGEYSHAPHNEWLAADVYNALTRFAVPVFVMVTGALLLGRDEDIFPFLKKRLTRVVVPFIFWSMLYIAYSYYTGGMPYTGKLGITAQQIMHCFKFGASYHLWYVYMLIGLYFVIPVINKFIRLASNKEIVYFLVIWLLVMLIQQPYLKRYDLGIDLHYFSGYIGYLVLGYYLSRKTYNRHIAIQMLLLFLATAAGITVGTAMLFNHYQSISTLLYEPLSPPVVVLSASFFLMIRHLHTNAPPIVITLRNFIGQYSYGVYLCHALVLLFIEDWAGLLDDVFDPVPGISYRMFNPFFSIPLTALIALFISLLLVWLINRIPFAGKYISG